MTGKQCTTLPFVYPLNDNGFWDFEPSSKINVLSDRRHTSVILSAITNPHTDIANQPDGTFIFYVDDLNFCDDCALLVKAKDLTVLASILIASAIPHYN